MLKFLVSSTKPWLSFGHQVYLCATSTKRQSAKWLSAERRVNVVAIARVMKLFLGDAIAEPLYALIGEVFDMRGVFKILRKSLIAVVQVNTHKSAIF